MQILFKILVTLVAGSVTFLLTNISEQPKIWQITISVFVAGVVLVVQFLIDVAEQTHRLNDAYREQAVALNESVGRISEAATHLATAEGDLGRDRLSRMIEAAGRLDRRDELQLRFVGRQVDDLADLLEGLRSGRAEHKGDDPDWLLGLTDCVATSIAATSMTSFEKHQGFVDEGDFWVSDLGLRYLERQRRAIMRKVQIRRLFLLAEDAVDPDRVRLLLEPHQTIGVQVRTLRSDDISFLHQYDLADFILFDQKISYEFHTARAIRRDVTPLITHVALVVNPDMVRKRQEQFEELWEKATPQDDPAGLEVQRVRPGRPGT